MPALAAPTRKSPALPAAPGVHYEVRAHDLHAHLWHVTLTVHNPGAELTVSLPVWLAGSYMVREFSKHMQHVRARQGKRAVALRQVSKNTWSLRCTVGKAVHISAEVYAHDASVRSAWLDSSRGFFNPTSLCLRVHGCDHLPHLLTLVPTPATQAWSVFVGLDALETPKTPAGRRGFCTYLADNYQELSDSPFELGLTRADGGSLWVGEFVAHGTPHRFVVAGAWDSFDGDRLLADTQRICETVIDFWHPAATKAARKKARAPMRHYTFMLNAVSDGYGGLEHHNSTALIAKRADLPQVGAHNTGGLEGYTTLLGLISHEYFHTWNVKRMRPIEFERYALDAEQYTELLWFFEGFTSYFDDLLLHRAGLISEGTYLKLLEKTANGVLAMPGRFVQSVAQSSFDAWVKYYRQDENTPNATISYYTKGALVGLCLDLSLRSEGQTDLDCVMRALYERTQGGPMTEHDVAATLAELSGRSWVEELKEWVHGTQDLPIESLLEQHGVHVVSQRLDGGTGLAASLGLRVSEGTSMVIKAVLNGSPARAAGLSAGDEWWAVELVGDVSQRKSGASVGQRNAPTGAIWRLGSLQELRNLAGPGAAVFAWVARDARVLRLPLQLPSLAAQAPQLRFAVADIARLARWLGTR